MPKKGKSSVLGNCGWNAINKAGLQGFIGNKSNIKGLPGWFGQACFCKNYMAVLFAPAPLHTSQAFLKLHRAMNTAGISQHFMANGGGGQGHFPFLI